MRQPGPPKNKFVNDLSRKALAAVLIALLPLPVSFLLSYESSSKHLRFRVLNDLAVVAEAYEGQVLQFLERARMKARKTREGAGPVQEFSPGELGRVLSGELGKDLGAKSWTTGRPKSMEVYIVDGDGRVVATSAPGGKDRLRSALATSPVNACRNSEEETRGFYRGSRGTEVAGAAMCLPSMQWTLIVEADADEVMGPPLADMRRNALAATALVGVILAIFFALFFRNVIAPLRRIAEAAREIAGGEFTAVIPVRTRDEIGSLSQAFNDMVRQIDSRTAELRRSEARLASAQRIARLGHWEWDVVKDDLRYSDEVSRLFGIEPGAPANYETLLASVHGDDRDAVRARAQAALLQKETGDMQYRVVRPDGAVSVVHDRIEVFFDESGRPLRMAGTAQDVTDLKQAEDELRMLTAAIEHSVNVVFITDRKGYIEYANPTFEAVTGWSPQEVIGKTPNVLASGVTPPAEYQKLWETISAGRTWRGVFMNKRRDGRFYWGSTVITPIRNDRGDISHFLAVQEDITEHKKTEDRVKYLAAFDELTGLVNRTRFLDLLDGWIRSLDRLGGQTGCLLLIDLDEFKFVNDTYGHSRGDQLISRIGSLLNRTLRDMIYDREETGNVLLGRMGGDEFAAFLPGLGEQESMETADILRRVVEGFRTITEAATTTVSIGMALYPRHGAGVQELFAKADAALYHSKQTGKNRIRMFHEEDRDPEFLHSKMRQKEMIQEAIADDRFEPWFQPILDLHDGTRLHYEALARLRTKDGDVLVPDDFIETAERFAMIGAIDRIIMKKTMAMQAKTSQQGMPLTFAMNLSGRELGDEDVLAFLQQAIRETDADPPHLIFEITETAAVRDLDRAITFVNALREMGCRFSLDDFGVGFTSFLYLRELRVDFIKIDGSFIRNLRQDGSDRYFVKAITEVAKGMNIKTVAEFVETGEMLDTVREYGVDYAQGYIVGRPLPALLSEDQHWDGSTVENRNRG